MQIYDGSKDKKVFPTNHTLDVISAGRVTRHNCDHMTLRSNGRVDWSLFYCEAGFLYVEDQVLLPGQLWVYPAHVPQKYWTYADDHTIYHYLHFTGSDIAQLLESLGIAPSIPLTSHSKLLLGTFENIQAAMGEYTPLSRLKAEYSSLYLLSQIANVQAQAKTAGTIHRVIDAMEHSFAEPYNADAYAKMLGISVSRFNHLFKEQAGCAPYAYLLRLRMDNAAALLKNTQSRIQDIARHCGFEDPLHFTQAFKKLHGMTPSCYRKVNQL